MNETVEGRQLRIVKSFLDNNREMIQDVFTSEDSEDFQEVLDELDIKRPILEFLQSLRIEIESDGAFWIIPTIHDNDSTKTTFVEKLSKCRAALIDENDNIIVYLESHNINIS